MLVDLRRARETLFGSRGRANVRSRGRRWSIKNPKTIVAIVALLIVLAVWLIPEPKVIRIVVTDVINQSGEAALDGLSGLLIISLEQSPRLSVMSRERMFDILKQLGRVEFDNIDVNLGILICQKESINHLLVSTVRKLGNKYSMDLKCWTP